MACKTYDIEEDNRKYREFLKSQQFRNATNALTDYETDTGGLTPAEVWNEVNQLLDYLKTVEAEDREDMVSQLFSYEKRRLRIIERDGESYRLDGDEMDRTLTSIFYCLALRLERTSRVQKDNPHNDLIDAIVARLGKIHHPVLALLHYVINRDGDRYEQKHQSEIQPLDPLAEDGEWTEMVRKIFDHYSNRMWEYVERTHQTAYNKFWDAIMADGQIAALMQEDGCVKGNESAELGAVYNAKAVFNIFGMLYSRGFFQGITGWKPLAEKVSLHYDEKTKMKVCAKPEYFKPEHSGILDQFIGIPADIMESICKLLD